MRKIKDFREQWNKVNMEFFKELVKHQNMKVLGEINQQNFNDFVVNNKEKIDNPDYLQILAENIEPSEEFFKENFDICKIAYDFMQNNQDWQKLNFSLRTFIRLGIFEETFKDFLNSH